MENFQIKITDLEGETLNVIKASRIMSLFYNYVLRPTNKKRRRYVRSSEISASYATGYPLTVLPSRFLPLNWTDKLSSEDVGVNEWFFFMGRIYLRIGQGIAVITVISGFVTQTRPLSLVCMQL